MLHCTALCTHACSIPPNATGSHRPTCCPPSALAASIHLVLVHPYPLPNCCPALLHAQPTSPCPAHFQPRPTDANPPERRCNSALGHKRSRFPQSAPRHTPILPFRAEAISIRQRDETVADRMLLIGCLPIDFFENALAAVDAVGYFLWGAFQMLDAPGHAIFLVMELSILSIGWLVPALSALLAFFGQFWLQRSKCQTLHSSCRRRITHLANATSLDSEEWLLLHARRVNRKYHSIALVFG